LEDRTLLSGDLLATTQIPGIANYQLMQFDQQGNQVVAYSAQQEIGHDDHARGLSVDPSGNVDVFNGSSSPTMGTFSPTTQNWTYQTAPGWGSGGNQTDGEAAAYKNYVFASNEGISNGQYGIVRFDSTGGSPVTFASGFSFTQVALGQDGLLYGLADDGAEPVSSLTVEVFNPDTLALVRYLTLKPPQPNDIRSIAVDGSGNIYAAAWDSNNGTTVTKYDSIGNPTGARIALNDLQIPMNIALDTDGQIAVGGSSDGNIYLTNEYLTSVKTIATHQVYVFVTFDHYIGTATPKATFLKTDTTTQGNWQGVYGSEGYNVIGDASHYAPYLQATPSGNSTYVWAGSTTDPRALQEVGSTNHIAATWYAGTSSGQGFTVNLNLGDGLTHQLALYLLDWDQYGGGRSEQVQISDAKTGNVLDTENVSNFGSGEYLLWNVSGNVQISITSQDSFGSAVLSGLFLDPIPLTPTAGKATYVKTDTSTQGNWQGVYGSQGYNVIDDAASYPPYARISPSGNSNYVWTGSTTDPRALQEVNSNNRIAACWYAGTSMDQGFTVNVNITDGQTHQLALYLLDWDQYGGGRSEQVQLYDATTGTQLSAVTVSNFGPGKYLVWDISGDVQIRILSLDNFGSAVLSGLFLDAVPSPPPPPTAGKASFVKTDTTTQGNWQGAYGSQGYNIIDDANSYPSYAQISPSGNSTYVWANPTTDPRALQEVGNSNRIAACWYAGTSSGQGFTVNVNLTDSFTHQLSLYLLDWDQYGGGRSEQIQILDATTGNVLDTENASNFGNGKYMVWYVSGDIQIRITSTDSFGSAVLSGLFLG
jgi:hypothetical protein